MTPALSHEIALLSPRERLTLIGELWDSLAIDNLQLTAAQDAELDHRIEGLDEERGHAVPWDSVKADLSTRIRN